MTDKSSQLSTLASTIQTGINNRLKDLHTAMPGIIETFDPVTQLASVQPAVRRIIKTVNDESIETLTPTDISILINVPVNFPGGGGFHLTFPVAKGDECLLIFCERSYDRWYNFGGVQDPGARRFHALSDATAFVGITSKPNSIPDYSASDVQLKKDDGSVSITLTAAGAAEIVGATEIDLTAPTIKLNGNVESTGTFKNNTKEIGSVHGHVQANDGGGNVEQPITGVTP